MKKIKFTATCPYEDVEKEYQVSFSEEPFCEHCYELSPFEPLVYEIETDGETIGIPYCLGCVNANGLDIEEELMEEIEATTKTLQKKFYKKKLKELE